MMKKHLLSFMVFAIAILAVDLLLYFINHGNVTTEEFIKVLKVIVLTGVVLVPIQYYIGKKKRK